MMNEWIKYQKTFDKSNLVLLTNPKEEISFQDGGKIIEKHFFSKVIFEEEIIIENYPKLKVIELGNCGITKITIRNCPQLEIVYLGYNQISEIEIDAPSLKTLNLSGNLLKEINSEKILNLENLIINDNRLEQLEVNHLKNLKTLWCFRNRLTKIILNDLIWLEDLNVSANVNHKIIKEKTMDYSGKFDFYKLKKTHDKIIVYHSLSELEINNCPNLRFIDADINFFKSFRCFYELTKLEKLSLRQTNLAKNEKCEKKKNKIIKVVAYNYLGLTKEFLSNKLELNSRNLTQLDISNSKIFSLSNSGVSYDPEKPGLFLKTLTNSEKFLIVDNERRGYLYKGKAYNLRKFRLHQEAAKEKRKKKKEKRIMRAILSSVEMSSEKEVADKNLSSNQKRNFFIILLSAILILIIFYIRSVKKTTLNPKS